MIGVWSPPKLHRLQRRRISSASFFDRTTFGALFSATAVFAPSEGLITLGIMIVSLGEWSSHRVQLRRAGKVIST